MLFINFKALVALNDQETILKTNRHNKKSGHFLAIFFLRVFVLVLLVYVKKELDSYLLGFYIIALRIFRYILKKIEKRDNSAKMFSKN